ncbi:cell division protein FtsQ [Lactobacillaceae bacterium L1_55_11]|nr:cell division protein FtsQ [Lactobacillaceae bacterium L1_55_11]
MKNFFQRRPVQLDYHLHPIRQASLIFVLCIGVLLVWVRPWEKITKVSVNAVNITTADAKDEMGIDHNLYRWQVVGQEYFLAQRLSQSNRRIQQVQVQVKGDVLAINVIEKINTGFVKRSGHWVELDRNGNPKNVSGPDGTAPIYSGFKTVNQEKDTALGVAQLDYVVRHDISQIIMSPVSNNSERLILVMDDGNTVYASQSTFMDKLPYYPSIVAQMKDKGIVDLQYGSYSYPYGSSDSEQHSASDSSAQSASSQSQSSQSSSSSQSQSSQSRNS